MRRRALAALLLVFITIAATSAPAFAGDAPVREGSGGRISVDGGLLIGGNERVDGLVVSVDGDVRIDGVVDSDVYVVAGDLRISGRVREDVLVIGGDATLTGTIQGDLVVLGGRAILPSGDAFVGGDVRSTDQPRVTRGARVDGNVDELGWDGMFGGFMFALFAFIWLAVTVSGAIIGLLFVLVFPRAADATVGASGQVGSSIAWGVAVGIVGPIVAVLAIVSLVVLPFGLVLGAGIATLAALGYVTSALCLGRLMVKATTTGGRIGAFFAGFGILRAVAIIPGIGWLVGFLATVFGIGVLVNAAWRASRPAPSGSIEPLPEPDAAPAPDAAPGSAEPTTEPDVPAMVGADAGADASTTTVAGTNGGDTENVGDDAPKEE